MTQPPPSTRDSLLDSARRLRLPTPGTAAAFSRRRDAITARVNEAMLARPDLDALIGPGNRPMMLDNHKNHALYFESMLLTYDAELHLDTVLWVLRTYMAHGFAKDYWAVQLPAWSAAIEAELPGEAAAQIRPFYDWLAANLDALAELARTTPSIWEMQP